MEFYRQSKQAVFKALNANPNGLTAEQAKERQARYGKNELPDINKKNPFFVFLSQFKDFLVLILIVASLISMLLGDIGSAAVILLVITMNAVLGTMQTLKAEASLDGLKTMSAPTAKVYRDGKITVLDKTEITVGDVVLIEAGDRICADGRIIENAGLKTDESALTGESEPAEKEDVIADSEKLPGDRKNMLYSGCFATYGRAKMLVTAVGMQTEIGKIATLLQNTKERKTPLQASLDAFGQKLSLAILAVCALIFALSVLRGEALTDAFIFAVALAVAAIPEALSSIVTIVLSGGTRKLAAENAVIRKLHAVEGLGSVSVICSDKTGTLTQNKMTVQKLFFNNETIDKNASLTALQSTLVSDAVLCNDAILKNGQEIGDPTEIALLRFAETHAIPYAEARSTHPRVAEIPFDSDRKCMSTLHADKEQYKMITKGAFDVLLPRISEIQTAKGTRAFTKEDANAIQAANLNFAQNGLRVLCVCSKTVPYKTITVHDESSLTFLGLIAMQDPPRPESKAAVEKCKSAGIIPVMITGDHLLTACAVAREIGILTEGKRGIEGKEIEKLTDRSLQELVPQIAVYARVSPEHKIRIVNAWQARGCTVSMTGDGVNDAPALKQADIGVAMGITGSEIAKSSSSLVLTDDNFATIVSAIENGRNIYNNIQKAISFLLSGNLAAIITVLFASLLGLPVPFTAVHLLFINLLTDSLPAIALGVEPHSADIMHNAPRPKKQSILTKTVLAAIGTDGLIIAAATVASYCFGLQTSAETASTMAFATLCLSRLLHGFNCKREKLVLFQKAFLNNKSLNGAFGIGLTALSVVLFVPPLRSVFAVAPLTIAQTAVVGCASLATLSIIQSLKLLKVSLHK